MRKPDRFALVAQKCVPMVGDAGAYRLQMSIIADALKREHNAVVRLVKRLPRYGFDEMISPNDLLAALAKRAR